MTDLHPDVVNAISELASTKLGRRYDRFARKRYHVPGTILLGKTNAAEFGGRSTATGRGVVSSAGARGPFQFIRPTRDLYKQRYGVDAWAGDKQAAKAAMLHHLNTGVEGYNPGMPTYKDLVLGQKLDPADRRALRRAAAGGGDSRGPGGSLTLQGPQQTDVTLGTRAIPGQSFAADRQAAKRELLLGGDMSLRKLLEYKQTVGALQDVPARRVAGDIQVKRTKGAGVTVPARGGRGAGGKSKVKAGGQIYEVFYDPMGRYFDSGKVVKGAIGRHGTHVHVSADPELADELGYLAERMGLTVDENETFGKVDPVHTEESFHYKNMAIDVSGGTPAKLRKFARLAMQEARRRQRRGGR
jgi:hypothetical protein